MEPTHMLSETLAECPAGPEDDGSALTTLVNTDGAHNARDRKHRVHLRQHGDHYDKLRTLNVWTMAENVLDYMDFSNDWIKVFEDSISNEQLYNDAQTQIRLQTLAKLARNTIRALQDSHDLHDHLIPLCEEENGDEYQIRLFQTARLADIRCPLSSPENILQRRPLMLLKARIPAAPGEQQPLVPKLVVQLGYLQVRGVSRWPEHSLEREDPETELTDFDVVVDIEHEDMPLWLLVSRQQLKDRIVDGGPSSDPIPLRVFQGLMWDEDKIYDTACILPSIRRLGADKEGRVTFLEVCDQVRATRCIRDPLIFRLPNEQLAKFEAGEQLDDFSMTDDLGYNELEERLFPESILHYTPEDEGELNSEQSS